MERKYVSFDIEVAKCIPDDGSDWLAHRPLGITCAATWASDEDKPVLWYSDREFAPDQWDYADKMKYDDLGGLVVFLDNAAFNGYTLLTHNGTSFDMDVLAEESGMFDECRELALNAVDTCFHALCLLGYPVALDGCARGMNVPGKSEGMDGSKAPLLWAAGEYDKVFRYVANDTRVTLDVAQAVERTGKLQWYSRRQRLNWVKVDRWLTVKECLELPLPDTAWMTDPMPRSKFTAWMQVGELV